MEEVIKANLGGITLDRWIDYISMGLTSTMGMAGVGAGIYWYTQGDEDEKSKNSGSFHYEIFAGIWIPLVTLTFLILLHKITAFLNKKRAGATPEGILGNFAGGLPAPGQNMVSGLGKDLFKTGEGVAEGFLANIVTDEEIVWLGRIALVMVGVVGFFAIEKALVMRNRRPDDVKDDDAVLYKVLIACSISVLVIMGIRLLLFILDVIGEIL